MPNTFVKRKDIKGFTLKIGHLFIEVVYHYSVFNLKVIALNWKSLRSKTLYVLDLI